MADLLLPDNKLEMPELFYPGRKPVGNVKLNKGSNHFMVKDLVFCLPTLQYPARELINEITPTNSGVDYNIGKQGIEALYDYWADDHLIFNDVPNFEGNAHTVQFRVHMDTLADSGSLIFNYNHQHWGVSSSLDKVWVAGQSISDQNHLGGDGSIRDWFFVSNPSDNTIKFYENGVLLNTATGAATLTAGPKDIWIGAWYNGNNSFSYDGGAIFCNAWSRALSISEMQLMTDDPYPSQVFIPA